LQIKHWTYLENLKCSQTNKNPKQLTTRLNPPSDRLELTASRSSTDTYGHPKDSRVYTSEQWATVAKQFLIAGKGV